MMRGSNKVIGIVNFITFLVSIPILAGGIWLSTKANSTDCLRFLQWPIIIIAVCIMLISLMGFAGACYRQTWLLQLYLISMFIVVVALLCFIVFAFAVTDRGHGEVIMNRGFLEYQLSDYSGWLKDRVSNNGYWRKIIACLREGGACKGIAKFARDRRFGVLVPETAEMFYRRKLSPIQSGCCKPPTSCGFTYISETLWSTVNGSMMATDPDCTRWSNDQRELCYRCDSCKAGVLASIRHDWRKASTINIAVLIILVIVYVVGCAAYRNNRRMDNDEPHGQSRMTKARPSWFQF